MKIRFRKMTMNGLKEVVIEKPQNGAFRNLASLTWGQGNCIPIDSPIFEGDIFIEDWEINPVNGVIYLEVDINGEHYSVEYHRSKDQVVDLIRWFND